MVDIIRKIPSVWDETNVLSGSKIGELAAFARRKDDIWFVGIINGPGKRRYNLDLTFIGEGSYNAVFARLKKRYKKIVLISHYFLYNRVYITKAFRRIFSGRYKMAKHLITILTVVVVSLVSVFAVGCESDAQTGALIGTAVGAGVGQAIGSSTESTLIGAGVGAVGGYIIGNEQDKKK